MIVSYCSGCGKPIEHTCAPVTLTGVVRTFCTRCGDALPLPTEANVHLCNLYTQDKLR